MPGIVRGPGQENWDIAFGKDISMGERLHAEIRADMFNAFNHTQWTGVDTTIRHPVFSLGKSQADERDALFNLQPRLCSKSQF